MQSCTLNGVFIYLMLSLSYLAEHNAHEGGFAKEMPLGWLRDYFPHGSADGYLQVNLALCS